jgi:uncharacterized LabA/DUF88 family protein
MRRVVTYVDGHNLYYGLRARYGRRNHWLDIQAMAQALTPPRHVLERVYYFTARVRSQPLSVHRQSAYLAALASHCSLIRIVEGRFQRRLDRCLSCGAQWTTHDEKETDVNISVTNMADAVQDKFDTAILVSADGDLAPAITAARQLSPAKRFYAAFPPHRRSGALARVADAAFAIGDDKIRAAQLPDKITLPDGTMLERPAYWR